MTELHRITADPAQCGGRLCLRGLRIRVGDVLSLLAVGASRQDPIVWLRLPNTRRTELLAWFDNVLPSIISALERGEKLIEVV